MLSHQVSGDPFGFHEILLFIAAGGGAALMYMQSRITQVFSRFRAMRTSFRLWLKRLVKKSETSL